jgi:hypothetical protein
MPAKTNFQVVFPACYDERGEWEAKEKGWLQGVEVRFPNGDVHTLFFYDPVRTGQDLEMEAKYGKPFIAHAGLVVIPEITREAMVSAVAKLVETDFFSTTKGMAINVAGQ